MIFIIKAHFVAGSFCLCAHIFPQEGDFQPSRGQRSALPKTEARVPGTFGPVLERTIFGG